MTMRRDIKETFLCPAVVVLASAVAAVVMGAVWGVIEWMCNFGGTLKPFPYFDHSQIASLPFRSYQSGSIMGMIEDLINLQNMFFLGGTRNGSGIGLIAAALVSMGFASGKSLLCRLLTGLVAGALVGARTALIFGSGVRLFLFGLVSGACLAALYMVCCEKPEQLPELPRLELPEIDAGIDRRSDRTQQA